MPDQIKDEILTEQSLGFGGMFTLPNPALLTGNQYATAKNIDMSVIPLIKKRKAYVKGGSSGFSAGNAVTTPMLKYFKGNTYLAGVQSATTKVARNGTLMTSVPSAACTCLVPSNTRLFYLSSTGSPGSALDTDTAWTSEGDTNTSFPRGINAIWLSQARMLAITDLSSGVYTTDLIWYSASNDAQTWDRTTNAIRLTGGREPNNQNIIEWKNNLVLVFKRDGVFILDVSNPAPSQWSQRQLIYGVGCASTHPQAVCRVGDDIMWVGMDGIYSLNQCLSGVPHPISDPIYRWIRDGAESVDGGTNMAWLSSSSFGLYNQIFLVYLLGQVWICNTVSTYTGIYRYNVSANLWDIDTGRDGLTNNTLNDSGIMAADVNYPNLIAYGGTNVDDGVVSLDPRQGMLRVGSSQGWLQCSTRGLDFGSKSNEKKGEAFEVFGIADAGSSLTIQYQLDLDTTWTALPGSPMDFTKDKDGNAATAGQLISKKFPLNNLATFRVIRFRLSDGSNNNTAIVGWACFARMKNLEMSR